MCTRLALISTSKHFTLEFSQLLLQLAEYLLPLGLHLDLFFVFLDFVFLLINDFFSIGVLPLVKCGSQILKIDSYVTEVLILQIDNIDRLSSWRRSIQGRIWSFFTCLVLHLILSADDIKGDVVFLIVVLIIFIVYFDGLDEFAFQILCCLFHSLV